RSPGARLRLRAILRHRRVWHIFQGHGGAWGLPATVAVRGVVPVRSAHPAPRRSHDQGGAGCNEGGPPRYLIAGGVSRLTRRIVPAGNLTSVPSVAAIVPPPPIRTPISAPLAPPMMPPMIAPLPAPAPIFATSPLMPSLSSAC